MIKNVNLFLLIMLCLSLCIEDNLSASGKKEHQSILRVATTSSTENSGLINVIFPAFTEKTGIPIHTISSGTGEALQHGINGNVDLIFVHAPEMENLFIAQGYGLERIPIMYNYFIVVGPRSDPANVKESSRAMDAFASIAKMRATFISRGDKSGTHMKELLLWKKAEIVPEGKWYVQIGQGMGAMLTIAAELQAYALVDRGTWLAYRRQLHLSLLHEGDPILYNPYTMILVNPEKHEHVQIDSATLLSKFMISDEGQALIDNFKIEGQSLFHSISKKRHLP